MKKKLLPWGLALFALSMQAQQLQQGYIQNPNSSSLHSYIIQWKKGTPIFEDENFYVSRIKPKARFRNTATQVNESFTETNDKKLLFWVPINSENAINSNAHPNGLFDSEAFSTWSYVTHYGNWISPYGWVPAAFADVAHKNGVAVSGVASIPWGDINSNTQWKNCLEGMASTAVNAKKLVSFMHYFGVDGLAYNSEFSGLSAATIAKLNTKHAAIVSGLKEKGNPVVENIWYDGTNDNGNITFDNGLGNHNNDIFGDGSNPRTSLFFNYNWNKNYVLNSVSEASIAQYAPGRSALDIYAGHNQQASNPKSWIALANSPMSIGLWGGHQFNYLWAGRSGQGSAPLSMQRYYQTILERFFTNYNSNPIDAIAVYDAPATFPHAGWFGMSAMMSARSTLKWDLTEEPFISYFNVGNGQYFNWKGVRQHNRDWYNIGVQDYMPTWRYWFANEFLGKEKKNVVSNGLKAEITYDDAYVGGSCLRIHGTSANEYLHLFKTEYALQTGDVITVRYKLVSGTTQANLSLSLKGNEATQVQPAALQVIESSTESDDSQWTEKKFTVSGRLNSLTSSELAMVALHFTDAQDLDLYLGEFSIVRGKQATPITPEITKAQALAFHPQGADLKLIWNMPNEKEAGEPCYNLDVKTLFFKLWAQQQGCEPILMGLTTSWAGIIFSAPVSAQSPEQMRVGVSAVSLDGTTDSEIAWSDYLELPTYVTSDEIQITKTTIKPGEPFTISYVDPRHPMANWSLVNAKGEEVASATETQVFDLPNGLSEIGAYTLHITCDSQTKTYGSYVQISSWEVGAYPEIQTLIVKDNNDNLITDPVVNISVGDTYTLGYTGRQSDGAASRGIRAQEGFVGARVGDIGIEGGESFAVAAWIKFTSIPKPNDGHSTACFFGIEDRAGNWPQNNWGWHYVDMLEDGSFGAYAFPDSRNNNTPRVWYNFPHTRFELNSWTHVVMTFEYDDTQRFRSRLFINGEQQESTWVIASDDNANGLNRPGSITYSSGSTNDWASQKFLSINQSDAIKFFGGRGSSPKFTDGIIDEFQVYKGAITLEDVQRSYKGLDEQNLPSNLVCYWSFDTDALADGTFASLGTKAGVKLKNFTLSGGNSGKEDLKAPMYDAGSPFIPGSSYKITSVPKWTSPGAIITNPMGTATQGSAQIRFRREGDTKVTLTLTNSLGSHSKDYPLFKVATGIEELNQTSLKPYVIEGILFIDFAQSGNYRINIYQANGVQIHSQQTKVAASQQIQVRLGTKGIYIIQIEKDQKLLRSIKVLN